MSYVKVEEVRVCSIRALRPHGRRKLRATSLDLLMKRAPTKPPSADKMTAARSQPLPGYVDSSSSWIRNTHSSAEGRPLRSYAPSHTPSYGSVGNTGVTHTYPHRAYYPRTVAGDPRLESLLPSHYQPAVAPQRPDYIYSPHVPRHAEPQPPDSPVPDPQASPPKVFWVLLLLGAGWLFFRWSEIWS
jgi:hypothetical protein